MKKVLILILIVFGIAFADELDLEIFYEQNATHKQIDEKLDEILEFMDKNPQMIDKEFQEDRVIFHFIVNLKSSSLHKFDFDRLEKILKFKPDLNYDVFKFKSFKTTLLDVSISMNIEKEFFYEDEIIKLAKVLKQNGYDMSKVELLSVAYNIKSFKIYSYLLENGASNVDNLMLSVSFDLAQFVNKNGFKIYVKEPAQKDMREFVKSDKFVKFYEDKIRYLDMVFGHRSLKDFGKKDIEVFIKINSYLDNVNAIKFLITNGLKNDENLFKLAKEYANSYKSTEILKLLK